MLISILVWGISFSPVFSSPIRSEIKPVPTKIVEPPQLNPTEYDSVCKKYYGNDSYSFSTDINFVENCVPTGNVRLFSSETIKNFHSVSLKSFKKTGTHIGVGADHGDKFVDYEVQCTSQPQVVCEFKGNRSPDYTDKELFDVTCVGPLYMVPQTAPPVLNFGSACEGLAPFAPPTFEFTIRTSVSETTSKSKTLRTVLSNSCEHKFRDEFYWAAKVSGTVISNLKNQCASVTPPEQVCVSCAHE